MRQDHAETVALRALAWIAGQDDLMGQFLGASGLAPADLHGRAQDPEFLAAVLDFLTMDEVGVLAFCADTGLPPDTPLAARAALPGGGQMHWT